MVPEEVVEFADAKRTQFHILSFEGPDGYARAGGIASRIVGLCEALSCGGYDTHLWFVGDPALPGHQAQGQHFHLHRWCQWMSQHHPCGVYDGEDNKVDDYARSLPPFLVREVLYPHVQQGGSAVVLAEEWHTAPAVLHLHHLLNAAGVRDRVRVLWNANNTFGFHRVDWPGLAAASLITTVSRYMKYRMHTYGVDPIVIPNGLAADAFVEPNPAAVRALRQRCNDRTVVVKMARWDPDKRWNLAIDTVGELKQHGLKPLLLARGGLEAHGVEVLQRAAAAGLRVVDRHLPQPGAEGVLGALADSEDADIVNVQSPVDVEGRRVLFQGAQAVLANSSHEPFGLVGLEAMAVGGVACTGCSGEDYVMAGRNALVLQTEDPKEFLSLFGQLKQNPKEEKAMRRAGRATAKQFAWPEVIHRFLMPRLSLAQTP